MAAARLGSFLRDLAQLGRLFRAGLAWRRRLQDNRQLERNRRRRLALLDLENPAEVIRRSDEWVFGPSAAYEMTGDVSRVVFPCGWIRDQAADTLMLYYGAADTSIGVATASFSEVMDLVSRSPDPREQVPGIHPRKRTWG